MSMNRNHFVNCQHNHRLLCISVILIGLLLTFGCNRSSPGRGSDGAAKNQRSAEDAGGSENRAETQEQKSGDYLSQARRMFQIGDFDSAAKSAYNALLQDPASIDAALIASRIEAARGNHEVSLELAGSIDVGSRLGIKAIEIQYQQLLELRRVSEAADVLLAGFDVLGDALAWRHHAWSLLNRVGRREEASRQADVLCRAGHANEGELLSLLRRNDSYPFLLREHENPKKYFEPGLGLAKWYFTQRAYGRALEQLSQEYQADFPTPAAAALFGRLLAETQRYEELPAWHAKCGDQVREHGDYWSALGTFFFDEHQFEASARSFLEATVRDPTDDIAAHRLAKVFSALGRPDDAEQFRHGAVLLVQAEQAAENLIASPGDVAARDRIMKKVLERGRPFEVLQWSLLTLPAQAIAQRRALQSKRIELMRDTEIIRITAESSLFGIDPDDFSLQPAMDALSQAAPEGTAKATAEVVQLAVPHLVNIAAEVGLDFQWYQDVNLKLASIPIHEMMGGGIAVIDYDLDGWPDVYLAQGSGDPPTDACTRSNVLFRNLEMRFEAVTRLANVHDYNYSTGIAAGDVNQDGFPDLLLGSIGSNRLLVNNGDGTFRDATSKMGGVADRFTSSLAIADINGDALPDLFEAVYLEMEGGFKLPDVGSDGRGILPNPVSYFAQSDRWFENLGDGSFFCRTIDESVALAGTSLGLIVTDFDSSGANQVFVGNDGRANHFLVQSGDNHFRNVADAMGIANGFGGEANACMGIATGDFNRDSTLDLHITNFLDESANHFLQRTGGGFTDLARRYGIDTLSVPYIGFGTKAIDIDRNGWLDLIVANGSVFDQRHLGKQLHMPPQLLVNFGSRFDVGDVEDESGYWNTHHLGRVIAMTDFDQDGAIDFLVGHFDQPVALLHNLTRSPGKSIQFELVGTESERDAIGTRVVLTTADGQFVGWVTAGDGYLCSDEPIVDFGLGTEPTIEKAEIIWPSGKQQTVKNLQIGQRYLVVEGQATVHARH